MKKLIFALLLVFGVSMVSVSCDPEESVTENEVLIDKDEVQSPADRD